MDISNLYIEDFYINKNIPYLFNTPIVEYDMQEAGFSLIKEFKQLPEDQIKYLESITSKDERKKQIGLYERNDPAFKKLHTSSFLTARKLFFIANDIDSDNDILSIKRDAIITTRKCKETKVGEFINFRPKNSYTSYLRPLTSKRNYGKLEFYYSPTQLDVKGISDENITLHEDGMIKFLKTFFYKMENNEDIEVLDYLRNFITKYKRYEVDIECYRTFDYRSCFVLKDGSIFNEYWDEYKKEIDYSYNYNILISMAKVLI